MTEDSLKQKIKTALGFCKAKGKDYLGFDDPPYEPLLDTAAKYYGEVAWSYDLFEHYFQTNLSTHISNRASDAYLLKLIVDIGVFLNQNIQDVYIIVPLKGAYIDQTITVGNLSIVRTIIDGDAVTPPTLPFNDIVNDVARVTGIDPGRIASSLRKIIHGRASGFLSCPLLILKRRGQYMEKSNVTYVEYLLRYYNIFLRLLATKNNIRPNPHYIWAKAEHYFCIGSINNYNHFPLWGAVDLPFNFSFLKSPAAQNILHNIVTLFESQGFDDLQAVYFRSLRFFNFSTAGQKAPLNDTSFKILNILIAAETLMVFSTRGEKKKKLAHTMAGLANIIPAKKPDFFNSIIEVYNDRSSLVHAGNQKLSKYQIDHETKVLESRSFERLQEMMLGILTHFPVWYSEIQARTTKEKYLEEWKRKISAFIPTEKYNIFQKLIIKVIYFLKWIGRIYSAD